MLIITCKIFVKWFNKHFYFLNKTYIYIIWGELVHGSGFQGLKMFPQNEKLVFPLKKSFAENKWPLDKTSWKLFLKTVCDIHWRGSELLSQQRFDLTSSNFMYWCNTLPWVVAFAPIPPHKKKMKIITGHWRELQKAKNTFFFFSYHGYRHPFNRITSVSMVTVCAPQNCYYEDSLH